MEQYLSHREQTLGARYASTFAPLPLDVVLPGCTCKEQQNGSYNARYDSEVSLQAAVIDVKTGLYRDHNNCNKVLCETRYRGSLYPLYSHTFHVL